MLIILIWFTTFIVVRVLFLCYFQKKAKQVFGIEILEEAVRAAKDNADLNNIKNVQFYNEDVKEFIKKKRIF